jgi:cytosine/adenosine deaminase-related metal-dependent hydrolase
MIVYAARWVLPVTAAPIERGAVAVEGGRIAWVGPADDAPAGELRDLGDALLLPGLVNAHTHLELTAMRGFLERLEFQAWLYKLTMSRRAALDDHEMVVACARAGIVEGLRAGITTYADTSGTGAPIHAMVDMRVRGIMYHEVFGPDAAQRDASMAGLREAVERLRPVQSERVRLGISPHAPYSVSDALFAAAAELARAEGLPMAVHLAESEAEERYTLHGDGPFAKNQRARGFTVEARGRTPVEALHANGALGVRPLLIHCVRLSPEDVRRIAEAGCAVAHCPASNAKLGHGIAPARELLDAGVTVGLGSDSVASNNRMDILEEARLAVLFQNARGVRQDALTAGTALEMATIGGARALGWDDRVGSLEPGKEADLAAFSLGGTRGAPVHDPVAAAVFSLTGADAMLATVAGEELVRDGRVLGPHVEPAMASLREAGRRLRAWEAENRWAVTTAGETPTRLPHPGV